MDTFSYPAVRDTDTSLCTVDILNSIIGETWCCVHRSQTHEFLKPWIVALWMFFRNLTKMPHETSLVLARDVFLLNKAGSWVSHLQKTLLTEWSHLFCPQLWSWLTEPTSALLHCTTPGHYNTDKPSCKYKSSTKN